MSTRPYIKPSTVVLSGDMSGDITSLVTILSNVSMLSYGVSWSGSTPVGAISVEASNDYQIGADGRTILNAGTWNTLTLNYAGSAVSSVPVSGNTGNGLIDIDSLSAYAVRLKYTRTSGTGSLQATVTGKVA